MFIAKTCRGSNFLSNGVRLPPPFRETLMRLRSLRCCLPLLAPIALVVVCSDRTLDHNVLYH